MPALRSILSSFTRVRHSRNRRRRFHRRENELKSRAACHAGKGGAGTAAASSRVTVDLDILVLSTLECRYMNYSDFCQVAEIIVRMNRRRRTLLYTKAELLDCSRGFRCGFENVFGGNLKSEMCTGKVRICGKIYVKGTPKTILQKPRQISAKCAFFAQVDDPCCPFPF